MREGKLFLIKNKIFTTNTCVYRIYNIYLYCCNEATTLKPLIMNLSLDILNNPNEIFENDAVIINLVTEEITWKPMMFNPKLRNNIIYWLNERRNLNVSKN